MEWEGRRKFNSIVERLFPVPVGSSIDVSRVSFPLSVDTCFGRLGIVLDPVLG